MKKENIDKKIIRKFRRFVSLMKKEVSFEEDNGFINKFVNQEFLPPFKCDNIEFKSFNSDYFTWLFSNKAMCNLYNQFADEYYITIAEDFVDVYNLSKNENEMVKSLPIYKKN